MSLCTRYTNGIIHAKDLSKVKWGSMGKSVLIHSNGLNQRNPTIFDKFQSMTSKQFEVQLLNPFKHFLHTKLRQFIAEELERTGIVLAGTNQGYNSDSTTEENGMSEHCIAYYIQGLHFDHC